MQIQTNINALQISSVFRRNTDALKDVYETLASGSRINSAGDDAAGMQISNRLNAQIRGYAVAIRNANDGISMLQTAEGALQESTNILQRIRDIAVQSSNATNTTVDRKALNEEVVALKQELNRINETTTFGGQRVFEDAPNSRVAGEYNDKLAFLQTWLAEPETRISEFFGIDAKSLPMAVTFTPDIASGALATVSSGSFDANGRATSMTLDISLADIKFNPSNGPSGNDTGGGVYADRIIAHEMVHAVQFANWNLGTPGAVSTWFVEGSAELIHGADERLSADGKAAVTAVDLTGAWGGTSAEYSAGFLATRYMHDTIKSGGGDGIKEIMQNLASGNGGNPMTLNEALAEEGTWDDEADFIADFNANKSTFWDTDINLGNDDTGAIGGRDADNGSTLNGEDILANAISSRDYSTFIEDLAEPRLRPGSGSTVFTFQVGSYANETISVRTNAFGTTSLGIEDLGVTTFADSQRAITEVDKALALIDFERSSFGAVMNRMESSINNLNNQKENLTASVSRIRDTDFASATAKLSKLQIIQQASASLLSQANQSGRLALTLLS
ncbi:flagellinolysin [Psychrosphaera sp.]|nr:flagellinolysin [Psychrosphaera sp.]